MSRLLGRKNVWPHQYIKTTETKDGPLGLATKMICIHCGYYYWNAYPRPAGNCQARVDKVEMKRLLG